MQELAEYYCFSKGFVSCCERVRLDLRKGSFEHLKGFVSESERVRLGKRVESCLIEIAL